MEAVAAPAHVPAVVSSTDVRVGFDSTEGLALLGRGAKVLAASTIVPKAYQGSVDNCAIALETASRLGLSPLLVMQNLYVVHGMPAWSSKFLIACVNTSGRFTTLRYEWRGQYGDEAYGCRAFATDRATGEVLHGVWVDWAMVKAEGWVNRDGSKWKTPLRDQMFVYRAAAFWQRAYAPEISMGMSTVEDVLDARDIDEDLQYRPNEQTERAASAGAATGSLAAMKGRAKPATDATVVEATARPVDTPAASSAAQAPTAAGSDAPPPITFAAVKDAMQNAQSLDGLDDAASLIPNVVGAKSLQKELNAFYIERRTQLGGD